MNLSLSHVIKRTNKDVQWVGGEHGSYVQIRTHEVNPQFRRLGESERARVHVMSYQTLPLVCPNVFGPKFVVMVFSSILLNES
ncbi:hypothetical protein HanXRQr2_Chr03g0087541 [Helianthus annuus]|uniref:Uncharacterized protein n=1 Tax=Helianthus annuus TaxID=4232 RepID=A0A9K3NTX6_HELAN|nr:hypothetical protein HanXRQr2_Chr03g0087541 [Helianthus annuus]KAJ0941789.1 hypothetical protein HanPSC8_Chr03g0084221 [Helianthus annuus]